MCSDLSQMCYLRPNLRVVTDWSQLDNPRMHQAGPLSRVLNLHSLLTLSRGGAWGELGKTPCLFLQHRDGLTACNVLGIEYCLSLHTKLSLQPESFFPLLHEGI